MNDFEKSLDVLNSLFGKDCTFALATSKDNIPSVRIIPKEEFFHKDDVGYKVNFEEKTADTFPFIL